MRFTAIHPDEGPYFRPKYRWLSQYHQFVYFHLRWFIFPTKKPIYYECLWNACGYVDLALEVIDHKAKFCGPIKPALWWSYRDDVFDLWQQGLPALKTFTQYINSLYPTIKFQLVYSDSYLDMLDVTLHLTDGFIWTDVNSKLSDSHLYLPLSSSHPKHNFKAIPYGVALRLKRNCSENEFFTKRREEYSGYLVNQGYPAHLVNDQFSKDSLNPRRDFTKAESQGLQKHLSICNNFQSQPAQYKFHHQETSASFRI